MTELLLLVPSLALAVLLWDQNRRANEKYDRLLEVITDERKTAAGERADWDQRQVELLNRIQAPEVSAWQAPDPTLVGPPAVRFDNDADFQEAQRLVAQMESGS